MTKNLIYLVADALRPDYLGCYGNESILTTEIDRLAGDGLLFEKVISSAPWTIPSIATHLTGKYPHRLMLFSAEESVGTTTKTAFQRFKKAGFATAAYFDSKKVFEQWSDSVDHYGMSLDIQDILAFISKHKSGNFFIFSLYRGTHIPYSFKYSKESWFRSLEEFLDLIRYGGEDGIGESKYRYARAVEHFSEWYLRAILDRLKDEGILDDTAIIITADHGESWGERYEDKTEIDVFDMHGPLLYNDVLRVPLIMYNIGGKKGLRVRNMVRSVDIMPTYLDYLDMPFDADAFDGMSLRPLCEAGRSPQSGSPEIAFSSTTSYQNPEGKEFSIIKKFSVIKGDWKLIWSQDDSPTELYDLGSDPEETRNLAGKCPDKVGELKKLIDREISNIRRSGIPMSEEEKITSKIAELRLLNKI